MKVTFLGAGLYGEALGKMAELNDHEIKYYDPYKFPDIKIEDAISEAEAVVYVAPAVAYQEILPKLSKKTPLILASKGFVSMRPFEEFENFSVLSGAAFAEDLMEAKHLVRLTASSEISEQIFTTDNLTIEFSKDTKGIMLCGALKNVYAIGAGILLDKEHPEQYFSEAFLEMQDILKANGAEENTATLSCGLPDLLLSSTSDGRNYRYGREIRNHPKSQIEPVGTVEGVTVIESLKDFPDFIIPEDADLIKEIIKKVTNATK